MQPRTTAVLRTPRLDIRPFPSQAPRAVAATADRPLTPAPASGTRRTSFCLRFGPYRVPLGSGRFIIGRGADVHVRLTSRCVSRQHAVLTVMADHITLEDRSSRNGVFINGNPIDRAVPVREGDVIQIGDEVLRIERVDATEPAPSSCASLNHLDAPFAVDSPTAQESTPFRQLRRLADLCFAQKDRARAEAVLGPALLKLLTSGSLVETDATFCRFASRTAIRLARVTENGTWLDYVFRIYLAREELMPLPLVHMLFSATAKARSQDRATVREYIELIRRKGAQFGDEMPVVLHRLERFARL